MALTVTGLENHIEGDRAKRTGKIVFDTSYPTGGEAVTAALLGLSQIESLTINGAEAGFEFEYVPSTPSTGSLKVYFGGSTHSHTVGTIAAANSSMNTLMDISTWSYMKGSANTDSSAADQNASPTNGAYCKAAATFTTYAGTLTPTTQPDFTRNVCLVILNDSGSPLNLLEGTTTYTITGTLDGNVQTDTIAWTSTAGNKAIATAKYRYIYSTKAFTTVTNVTWQPAQNPDVNLKATLGLGSLMSIPKSLATPAEADVVKFTAQGVSQAISSIVSTTNNTINVGTRSDNDNVVIRYKTKGYNMVPAITVSGATANTTATAGTEVTNGTNLNSAGLTAVEFEAIGMA